MSLCTLLISRNLSSALNKPNGKNSGRVTQICEGDCTADWNSKTQMKNIYFWKTVELSGAERISLQADIDTPVYEKDPENDEGYIITVPAKSVDLDCFDVSDKTTLEAAGVIESDLGGAITVSNLITTNL